MMEVWSIILPIGILVMCGYGIGYMTGMEQAKEIWNPVVRKNDFPNRE